jgi:hypothetical protein
LITLRNIFKNFLQGFPGRLFDLKASPLNKNFFISIIVKPLLQDIGNLEGLGMILNVFFDFHIKMIFVIEF